MDAFKAAFEGAGATQFGSGWAWLIVQDGKLKVITTPNQDNSADGHRAGQGRARCWSIDVWEHAYYLKYQNRRAEYPQGVLDRGQLEAGQRPVCGGDSLIPA